MTGHTIDSTSISVSWEEVKADKQNGIITGYTIIYRSQTENHNGNVTAGPNDRQKDITGLKEYVLYNITVLAFTAVGNGPSSTPVLVVRTNEDGKLVILQKISLSLNCFINPCSCFCNHSRKCLTSFSDHSEKTPFAKIISLTL